jgi:hypothetical protein
MPISLSEVLSQNVNKRSHFCRQVLAVGVEGVDRKLLWQKVAKNGDQSARFQITGVSSSNTPIARMNENPLPIDMHQWRSLDASHMVVG